MSEIDEFFEHLNTLMKATTDMLTGLETLSAKIKAIEDIEDTPPNTMKELLKQTETIQKAYRTAAGSATSMEENVRKVATEAKISLYKSEKFKYVRRLGLIAGILLALSFGAGATLADWELNLGTELLGVAITIYVLDIVWWSTQAGIDSKITELQERVNRVANTIDTLSPPTFFKEDDEIPRQSDADTNT